MKKFKIALLSSLLLVSSLTACGENSPQRKENPNDLQVINVTLDVTSMKLEEGQTLQLHPTVTFKNEEVEIYREWKNSNPKVASVSESGLVTALSGGRTTITYIAGYKSAACTIDVPKKESPIDPPQPGEFTIYLNKTERNLTFGESFQLIATTSEEAEVSWTVKEGGNIVTVDSNGLVEAGRVIGSATVTATAKNKSASCVFTVSDEGEDEDEKTVKYFFFIDFNNADEEDETGTKLLASFKWYPDRPVGLSGLVPEDPKHAPTDDFPYFVGWSDHPFVDTKDDLIDVNTYTSGDTRTYQYLFGIWADVPKGEFTK